MKAIAAIVVLAIVALAAAQEPTAPPTKCETIMTVLGAAGSAVTTQQGMLVAVVDTAVANLASDGGVWRYFTGSNGYPNVTRNAASVDALKSKLIGWFSGYLGCTGTDPLPYTGANITLTASHAYLKISLRDASVFNGIIRGSIIAVLASQNVNVEDPAVAGLVDQITADLIALMPSYVVPATTFCDKYSNLLALAYINDNAIFPAPINTTFAADVTTKGTNWAFWRLFVDFLVIKQGIAGNPTGPVATTLLPFFSGNRTNGVSFLPPSANYDRLVDKLVAWFGQATGCSDLNFLPLARATGAVNATNIRVDLTASHQPLRITANDASVFNGVIASTANVSLTPFGLTSAELGVVGALLNSVNSQVIYVPPAPTAAAPTAAVPTTQAPRAAPVVAAPKSSASGVVASSLVVAASALFALVF